MDEQQKLEISENKTETMKLMEAILFAMNTAVEASELSKASGLDVPSVRQEMKRLIGIYEQNNDGLLIKEVNGKYQLCTNPKYFEQIVSLVSVPKKPVL